ncbi:MAG: spore maturation protein [Flavonifractor sp.]|nr:spore maturation protein [Flavonifractor sp.]MCI9425661.1 spore maturation protein [Flavonifractor sp.]MCI9474351.1 spore maturation protein [Flavonifractor sp.]
MDLLFTMLVPLIMAAVALYGMARRVDVYDALVQGAGDGLGVLVKIVPPLVGLLTAVYMLRASGVLELASGVLAPVLGLLGIPAETAPLLLVRPVSGSAALGVGAELISAFGPDSLVGRTAAVMLGSTETTFYTIAVYFGAAGIVKTRYAIPAALCADLAGFMASAWAVRVIFYRS